MLVGTLSLDWILSVLADCLRIRTVSQKRVKLTELDSEFSVFDSHRRVELLVSSYGLDGFRHKQITAGLRQCLFMPWMAICVCDYFLSKLSRPRHG